MIRAVGIIERERPGQVVLYITARRQAPPFSSRVLDLVAELGLQDVVLLTDTFARHEMPAVYASCDVFVFPSFCESFGLPMVEAMAIGLPTVVADVPVNREICGPAALYFQPFSPDELARRIMDLAVQERLREELREKARLRAGDYSWERTARRLLEAIEEVAGER
jgi:glycosyltransferase involved in cell wall biosynthesis